MGEIQWITKNGVHIPLTNDYMNKKIRKEQDEEINYKKIDMNDYNDLDITNVNGEITKDEERSLGRYSGIAYKEINHYLNNGKLIDDVDWTEDEIKGYIKDINEAINKSTLNYNVKLYKGTKAKYYEKFNVGDTFELKMFNSTSLKENVADRFQKYEEDRITLEIRARKGTKAIYMGDNYGILQNEQEILLQKNLKYKVLEKEKNRIVLEVLK